MIYKGSEKIYCKTEDELRLDAVGLKVNKVFADGKELPFEQNDRQVVIKTGRFEGVLEVEFEGKVKEKELVGIYKAPYNGTYVISTQFESSHAREFIPCVDHPAYKAVFKIVVRVDKNLDVISNMPVEKVSEEGDKRLLSLWRPLRCPLTYFI